MRHIFMVAFLAMGMLFGANLDWSADYEAAKAKAKKNNKQVYVLITSNNCKWCRKFETTTLKNDKILKRLYSEFEVVHISRDENKVPAAFETSPVPRHYFTDADGEITYSSLGHRDLECFESFMDNAQRKSKTNK